MKRTMTIILLLGIAVGATAQYKYLNDAFYAKVGATASRHLVIPSLAAGVQFNKNQLEFEYQQYRPERCGCLQHVADKVDDVKAPNWVKKRLDKWAEKYDKELPTQGWVSIRYSRIMPINNVLSFNPTSSAGVNITGSDVDPRFGFSAGAGIAVHLGRYVDIQTITSFPVINNQKGTFKYLRVQNGLVGTIKLFQ